MAILLSVVTILAAGQAVLAAPPLNRLRPAPLERLGLAILLGLGGVALERLLISLAGAQWSDWQLFAFWPPGAVATLLWLRPFRVQDALTQLHGLSAPIVAGTLVAVAVFAASFWAMSMQEPSWRSSPDGYAFYVSKAALFEEDRSMRPYYERVKADPASPLRVTQPDHPPLVPLAMTVFAAFQDSRIAWSFNAVSWLASVGLILTLFGLLRRVGRSAAEAGLFALLLLLLHVAGPSGFTNPGYADVVVSAYLLIGAGYLYVWLREEDGASLAVSAIGLGLAVLTKNDATPFLLLCGAVVAASSWLNQRNARRAVTTAAGYLVWGVAIALPWLAMREYYGVDVEFLSGAADRLASGSRPLSDLVLAEAWLAAKSVQTLWLPLIGTGLAIASGFRPNRGLVLIAAVVAIQLVAEGLIVVASKDEVRELLRHSASRLVLQVTPVAYLLAAEAIGPEMRGLLSWRIGSVRRQVAH